jgi:hypothetical protein
MLSIEAEAVYVISKSNFAWRDGWSFTLSGYESYYLEDGDTQAAAARRSNPSWLVER